MTVTSNDLGQTNIWAKEPQMVVESYNRKGLESPQQYAETYNGRWAMMGIVSGFISYAITGNFFFGIFWAWSYFLQTHIYWGNTMNEAAEKLNGRAAMIGFIAAVGAYLTTGQIIPGLWWYGIHHRGLGGDDSNHRSS